MQNNSEILTAIWEALPWLHYLIVGAVSACGGLLLHLFITLACKCFSRPANPHKSERRQPPSDGRRLPLANRMRPKPPPPSAPPPKTAGEAFVEAAKKKGVPVSSIEIPPPKTHIR